MCAQQAGALTKSLDARRVQASRMLSVVAAKLHDPRLAKLVYQIWLDVFSHAEQAVDHFIAELLHQKDDEIKHKDFCAKELNKNQLPTERPPRLQRAR